MKICAIICELNPLHNGHKYLFDRVKEISGCDKLLLIMSGSFTQRGEMCILDKYTRAKHAIFCGADGVIELPAPFAVAPAEVFAKGSIKLLSSIPSVTTLAFGCEDNDREKFLTSARLLLDESESFKSTLKNELESGKSYITAYNTAFSSVGGDGDFLKKPNNILGLEYTKAILSSNANIDILPIQRIGCGFNQTELAESYSSASGIRKNLLSPLIASNVPEIVYGDLKNAKINSDRLEGMLRLSLLNATQEKLSKIYGCGEGLENKLKTCCDLPLEDILKECTSQRYTLARINRILTSNLLDLSKNSAEQYLGSKLYIQPLAIKKERKDEILLDLSLSSYPLILKQRDLKLLDSTSKECLQTTKRSYDIWKIIQDERINDFDYMQII